MASYSSFLAQISNWLNQTIWVLYFPKKIQKKTTIEGASSLQRREKIPIFILRVVYKSRENKIKNINKNDNCQQKDW